MNQSKITQIIAVNNSLMAVVRTDSGHWTVPVICLELLEKFQEGGNGNHEIIQEKRPLVTWKGVLTFVAELPGYLGLACSKAEAESLYYQALTDKEFEALCGKNRKKYRPSIWSDSRVEPAISETIVN